MMRRAAISLLAVAALAISGVVFADAGNFNASRTFEFDPEHTGCPSAQWSNGIGEPDGNCRTSFGLLLVKDCDLEVVASAGAVLNNVYGLPVECGQTLGFDYKAGSPCTGGAPRFNVQWTDPDGNTGFSFVGGCGNGTSEDLLNGWFRVTFNPCDGAQTFPAIPAGSTYNSIVLIVDEPGTYTLDNIRVNGAYADKPGSAGELPSCE